MAKFILSDIFVVSIVILAIVSLDQVLAVDNNACTGLSENDCFLNENPKCYWNTEHGCILPPVTATPTIATRRPTATARPCDLGESACKAQTDICTWTPGVGCSLSNFATRRPTMPVRTCFTLAETDCRQSLDCIWFGPLGCKPRPPRVVCPATDLDIVRTCHIGSREVLRRVMNETRKQLEGANDNTRKNIDHDFWCQKVPGIIVNATRDCVKKCIEMDQDGVPAEPFGLGLNRDWCQHVNTTALDEYLVRHNCTRFRSCDEVLAEGISENSDLQSLLTDSSATFTSGVSIFIAILASAGTFYSTLA
jgi:hypothetical protein